MLAPPAPSRQRGARGRASLHLRDQHLGLARGAARAAGKKIGLAGVPAAEWDAIAALGFDAVWLMGVWERSPAGIAIALQNRAAETSSARCRTCTAADVVGSPYCVRDYTVAGTSAGRGPRRRARGARQARAEADPRLRAEPRRARPSVGGGAPRVLRAAAARTTSSATRRRSSRSATACSRTGATRTSPPGPTSCS